MKIWNASFNVAFNYASSTKYANFILNSSHSQLYQHNVNNNRLKLFLLTKWKQNENG
jgi:hypothetical protein